MGASGSVLTDSSTAEEVAEAIRQMGTAYEQYSQSVVENGVDGSVLREYDGSPDEILDDLGVNKKLHRTKFICEFKNYREKNSSSAKIAEGSNVSNKVDELQPPTLSIQKASESLSSKEQEMNELAALTASIAEKPLSVTAADAHHIFISYRVATEAHKALELYKGIRALRADKNFGLGGENPQIFLDKKSLKDGEPWEDGKYGLLNNFSCSLFGSLSVQDSYGG